MNKWLNIPQHINLSFRTCGDLTSYYCIYNWAWKSTKKKKKAELQAISWKRPETKLTWLRSNFSAVLRTLAWAFSRCLRRAIKVRRLRAGVAPSKTKTGLVRKNRSLQIRRKKPSKWAFRTISPLSSRIAFMNCTIQMLASSKERNKQNILKIAEVWLERRDLNIPMASFLPARVSTETRRPTGASSSQRPCTPIFHPLDLHDSASVPRCRQPLERTPAYLYAILISPIRHLKFLGYKNDVVSLPLTTSSLARFWFK